MRKIHPRSQFSEESSSSLKTIAALERAFDNLICLDSFDLLSKFSLRFNVGFEGCFPDDGTISVFYFGVLF